MQNNVTHSVQGFTKYDLNPPVEWTWSHIKGKDSLEIHCFTVDCLQRGENAVLCDVTSGY
jgi:hypothetical protein